MRVAQEVVQRVLERRMEVEVDVRSIVALLEAPPLLARCYMLLPARLQLAAVLTRVK